MFDELSGLLTLDASDYIGSADDAAQASEDLAGSADDASGALEGLSGIAAGAALAGVGTGAQKALDGTQPLRESLGRTSESISLTRDETSKLAKSLSNATFPVDDAAGTLDELARAGVDGKKSLEETANAADAIADATGSSATSIAESAVPALKAMGEEADSLNEHMDTFTFMARNTQMSVEDFSRVITKMGPELQEMGLSVDDTAAILATLEDQGMDSRTAMREFRQAARDADGDQDALMESLGLTNDELSEQQQALMEAEGSTMAHAEAANESLTTMDTLRSKFADAKLTIAETLGPVDALGPAMQTTSVAMMGMSSVASMSVVPSMTAVYGSMVGLLPIILPLVAVAGLLAAAWATNFGDIQGKVSAFANVVADVAGRVMEWVNRLVDIANTALSGDFAQAWEMLKTSIRGGVQAAVSWVRESAVPMIVGAVDTLIDGAVDTFESIVDALPDLARQAVDAIARYLREDAVGDVKAGMKAIGTGIRESALALLGAGGELVGFFEDGIDFVATYLREDAVDDLKTAAGLMVDGLVLGAELAIEALTPPDGIVVQMIDAITSYLKNQAWDDLKGAAEFLFDVVMAAAEGLYEGLIGGSLIPDLFNDIVDYIISTATRLVDDAIQGYVDVITDLFDATYGRLIFDDDSIVKSLFSDIVSYIKDTATGLVDKAIQGYVDAITEIFDATYGRLIFNDDSIVKTLFGDIKSFIEGGATDAVETATEILTGAVTSVFETLKSDIVGPDGIIPNLVSDLKGAIEDAIQWLKDTFNDAIPSSIGIDAGFNIPEVTVGGGSIPGTDMEVPSTTIGGGRYSVNESMSMPQLASGGIVTEPTAAMVGEGGESEAVLPLSKLESLLNADGGGGGDVDITLEAPITIEGSADESTIRKLRRELEEVVKEIERQQGRNTT